MKWAPLYLLGFVCLTANAQPLKALPSDLLEQKLDTAKSDRSKMYLANILFFRYLNADAKKALTFAVTGLAAAEKLKIDSSICIFDDCMGEAYYYMEDAKKALYYLNEDYALAKKHGYKRQMALAMTDLSGVYQMEGDDKNGADNDFKAIKLWEELKEYRQVALINMNIGVTFNNQNDFKKAVVYTTRALEIIHRSNIHDNIEPKAYEILGSAYGSLNNFAEARRCLNIALGLYTKNKNDFGVASILSMLVTVYPGEYQKELAFGLKAEALWNKIAPENFNSINNLGNIGSCYGEIAMHQKTAQLRLSAFNKSETYLFKAITIAKKTNTLPAIVDFSDSLSVIEAAAGKYRQAYTYLKLHDKLSDSIYSQDNKNKIASLEGRREVELRDKQLQINKLEIANQNKQRWFLLAGLGMLLVVASLIYTQSRQRYRLNQALTELNSELNAANKVKTRFFSILNHDLRSPIASFVNFLYLQQNAPDLMDERSRAEFSRKATASAENLLSTMEDLLLWGKGQMENFKPDVKKIPVDVLFNYIEKFFGENQVKITFNQTPGMYLHTDADYIKTIMQNLTNNSVKALGDSPGGIIAWKAWEEGDQQFLSVTDNGPGAGEDTFKALYDESAPIGIKTGLGLHIIRDLAKAIGCHISVSPNPGNGMEVKLKFN